MEEKSSSSKKKRFFIGNKSNFSGAEVGLLFGLLKLASGNPVAIGVVLLLGYLISTGTITQEQTSNLTSIVKEFASGDRSKVKNCTKDLTDTFNIKKIADCLKQDKNNQKNNDAKN